jgi:hypothetical protein
MLIPKQLEVALKNAAQNKRKKNMLKVALPPLVLMYSLSSKPKCSSCTPSRISRLVSLVPENPARPLLWAISPSAFYAEGLVWSV